MPFGQAADASGLLNTTVQLSQVVGIAGFGTVFLSLAQRGGPALDRAQASAAAMSGTGRLLALLAAIGLVTALVLARSVRAAARQAPPDRRARRR